MPPPMTRPVALSLVSRLAVMPALLMLIAAPLIELPAAYRLLSVMPVGHQLDGRRPRLRPRHGDHRRGGHLVDRDRRRRLAGRRSALLGHNGHSRPTIRPMLGTTGGRLSSRRRARRARDRPARASPAHAAFDCGSTMMICQTQVDNSGRVWFWSPELLTEDALGDGTLKHGVLQTFERDGDTTTLIHGPDGKPIPRQPQAPLLGVRQRGLAGRRTRLHRDGSVADPRRPRCVELRGRLDRRLRTARRAIHAGHHRAARRKQDGLLRLLRRADRLGLRRRLPGLLRHQRPDDGGRPGRRAGRLRALRRPYATGLDRARKKSCRTRTTASRSHTPNSSAPRPTAPRSTSRPSSS